MIFFFGFGTKSKKWTFGDGYIMATWSYFHIFWFPIAFNEQWHIIGDSRKEDRIVPYVRIQYLMPSGTPKIGVWQKYGLLFLISFFAVLLIFGN